MGTPSATLRGPSGGFPGIPPVPEFQVLWRRDIVSARGTVGAERDVGNTRGHTQL